MTGRAYAEAEILAEVGHALRSIGSKPTGRCAVLSAEIARVELIAPDILAEIIWDAAGRIDHASRADALAGKEAAKEALFQVLQAIADSAP